MKKYLLILGIISVFLLSACAQQSQPAAQNQPGPSVIQAADQPTTPVQAEMPVPDQEDVEEMVVVSDPGVKEFDVTAKKWDWNPATITVNEGDEVKLNIKNLDVPHGFSLFEFGVNERLPGNGAVTTVEFTADKAGEYTFFCSVPCGSGHGGMRGTLIVE